MPISREILTPLQAEAGHIKIGRLGKVQEKRKGGTFRLPEKLEENGMPYFLVTKMIREGGGKKDENFEIDEEIMARLPKDKDGKCRRIPIMLDSDLIEEVWPTSLMSYVGDELSCINAEGGKIAKRLNVVGQDKRRDWKDQTCPCERLGSRQDPKCKPSGSLRATILAGDEAEIGARHVFRTGGWNSIKAILAALPLIQRIVGTISGIKLWLVITPVMKKDRDRQWRRIPVVTVRFRTKDLLGVQQHAIETVKRRHMVMQLASNPAVLALPAPGVSETPAQQAAAAAEWYPETSVEAGDERAFDDDSDEIVDIEDPHDPLTGEVHPPAVVGDDAPKSTSAAQPSQRRTEPAVQAQGSTGDEPLDDAAMLDKIKALLKELALARGFDPMNEKEFLGACKEVLKQVTLDYVGEERTFKMLRRKDARFVIEGLAREIEQIAARDHEDGPGPEDPPA